MTALELTALRELDVPLNEGTKVPHKRGKESP